MKRAHLGILAALLLTAGASSPASGGPISPFCPGPPPKGYPISPPGESVGLPSCSFIQSIASSDTWWPPDYLVGDNIGQHPGAWVPPGGFIIGVLGGTVDTRNPDATVYAWETSGFHDAFYEGSWGGVAIQFGYWDHKAQSFLPVGLSQQLLFSATGKSVLIPEKGDRVLSASVTPLSAFGIPSDFPLILNAVRITSPTVRDARLTAFAIDPVIPEPATWLLLAAGLVGLSYWGQRGSHRE